ncbi:MAG TPA: hypothetical protein VLY23_06655 [Candidatus Acidoferrum sp.]|nr:hypothetical protein [Candidatus Acidoferrum sp.]
MASQDVASLIRQISDADPATRERAAAEIFRQGSDIAGGVLQTWLADSDLAQQFALRAGAPLITVGVAVSPNRFEQIRSANGSPPLADVPTDQDANEFELEFEGGIRLDILTSRDPGGVGAIARYLQKFGAGIQQVEVDVRDVDRATEALQKRFGIQPLYRSTRDGANGTRVNFFLVSTPEGGKVLIEFVEVSRPAAGA